MPRSTIVYIYIDLLEAVRTSVFAVAAGEAGQPEWHRHFRGASPNAHAQAMQGEGRRTGKTAVVLISLGVLGGRVSERRPPGQFEQGTHHLCSRSLSLYCIAVCWTQITMFVHIER